MRNSRFLLIAVVLVIVVVAVVIFFDNVPSSEEETFVPTEEKIESTMKIQSPAFEHNGNIPAKYTCDGENINPALTISEIPENAQSVVLIMDDPDALAVAWVHWTVWNINPATTEIAENSVPQGGVEGKTSFGKSGYGGPCPPSGTHRYFFKLYALNSALSLSPDADKSQLEAAMAGHILDQAELIGLYSRQ